MASYDDTSTISGGVLTFANGADEVYCKSVKVDFPISIEGNNSVSIRRFGKNLTDLSTYVDGYVNTDGTFNPAHTRDEMRSGFIRVSPNTRYIFGVIKTTGSYSQSLSIGLYAEANVESFISRSTAASFLTTEETNYIVISARNLKTATQIQFELGNKLTGYEPFDGKVFNATFGRTVYGGEVNVSDGTGTETHASAKFSDLDWRYYTDGVNPIFYAYNVPNEKVYSRGELPSLIIQGFTTVTANARSNLARYFNDMECSAIENGTSIALRCDSITSVADLIDAYGDTYVVYEMASESYVDFTFPKVDVPTRLVENYIFNDSSDTSTFEIEYYKMGYGYSTVTLNRALGKNLFSPLCWYGGSYNPSVGTQWELKVNNAQFTDNGDGSFSLTPAGSNYIYTFLIPVRYGVTYHLKMTFTSTATGGMSMGYLDGLYKVLSTTTSTDVPNEIDTTLTPPENARFYYIVLTNRTTAGATISMVQPQMEFGSSASQYEPYVEPVSEQIKLHRIVYQGEFDAINGTGTIYVGESGTEYDPPETISFDPVAMNTVAGNNVLYASEGDSAITYRRETE